MEEKQTLLVVILVLYELAHGEIVRRNGAVGCSHNRNLCRYDEFCNEAEFYPYGKCRRFILKKPLGNTSRKRFKIHGRGGYTGRDNALDKTKYDMTYFDSDESVGNIPSNEHNKDKTFRNEHESTASKLDFRDQNDIYKNSKYDMTHFDKNDFDSFPHEERSMDKSQERISTLRHLDGSFTKSQESDPLPGKEFLQNLERERSFKHGSGGEDSWPRIGIPLPVPYDDHQKLERKQTRNVRPIETQNSKSTEADLRNQLPKSDESLDLDIEIKPLTASDDKYFDEDKSKLSSIPEKPNKDSEVTQKIEHVQTNIVSKSASKKTKVGVLVGGKLDQAKTGIVQNNSPDPTYDKVKDFFKSQQVSSIVEAPLAEKKEAVKLNNIPHDGNVEVKRSSIPTPSVHPDRIRLDLKERLNPDRTSDLLNALQDLLLGNDERRQDAFTSIATDENKVSFHLLNNTTTNGLKPSHVVQRINKDKSVKDGLKKAVGVTVLSASLDSKNREQTQDEEDDDNFMMTTLIVAGCVSGILLVSICIFVILRRTSRQDYPRWVSKPANQGAASDYQSLWRQLRQATWDSPIQTTSVSHSDDGSENVAPAHKGMPPKYSWSEEPVDTKMDISTGHIVLAYMEDHLKNENRLSKEWEDLTMYEAEPDCTDVGKDLKNSKKNRYSDVLPYDHNRVKLRDTSNATGSDYINASYIVDDDPRHPAYIATQGPLASTVADFWQMVWEQGVVVIVMLTKLADLGLAQCHRYWPQKGHEVYHIYQVNLISEHIWCSDYLVRSFYLKNVQTGETRTVTQFHYLTWPHLGIPLSSKPLLDFRRKVLKCFRSHSCPVVVHCSGGIDRTGTYILIDMVLSKMSRGTKEIDIAATLEHLRDQRPQMVKTKAQFEFALASVAEEVNAILQVLAKH